MGGGGDGGYSARQAEEERRKQDARNALNVYFGVSPTASTVNRDEFYRPVAPISEDGPTSVFDDAAYQAALAGQGGLSAEAAKNKAALDALYSDVRTNAYTAGKRRADDQRGDAARDLKFELFARGLDGGSVDVDQNALLGREYTDALTQLSAKADQTATGLRSNDEQTRVGLLQSIDSGMDQGSAVSSALTQLRNNADRAAAEAQGLDLGDLFTNAGLLYNQGRRARGEQSASEVWARQFGQGSGKTNSGAARGVSTWAG